MKHIKSGNKILFWSLISFAIAVAVSGGIYTAWESTKPCPARSEKRIWGRCHRDLQAKPLTIGIAIGGPDEDYNALASYLRNQLGSQVEIDIDTPYEELSDRIARKDWDIAFTRSPIFSIVAEDNRYSGVAVMFPDQPPYYRAALYVRSDSPIQAIADIKPTTTLALGNPESAPTFHLPIYALYGKSLRVDTGYRPREVVEIVKVGKVDVGAGRYEVVRDDPKLRIIHVSKAIPGAGVYLSPKLSEADRKRITGTLLNAPLDIQAKANYGSGQIPKYDELRKIIARTETVLSCPGLNLDSSNFTESVDLFCKEQDFTTVEGQVEEYSVPTEGTIEFKVVTQNKQVYVVSTPRQILNQIPINPVFTVDKFVQIKDVKPRKLTDGTWEVKITKPNQLSLIKDLSLD